jgi:chorismate--pyruvate lyase
MTASAASPPPTRSSVGAPDWLPFEACHGRAPAGLLPWLAEPGLLTERVRAVAGDATQFRVLRVRSAPLALELRARLAVTDTTCLLREIEICCGEVRWIFAQSVFPESAVARHPWLRDLGESPLGEALRQVAGVERDPLAYAELAAGHALARSAVPEGANSLWARRAVYRLAGAPIIVQEVFLPGLGRCGAREER